MTASQWMVAVAGIAIASDAMIGASAAEGGRITNVVTHPPANSMVPRMMAGRAQEQSNRVNELPVKHDFKFRDVAPASGITFEQHSVEDALKFWKPAHYDHGSAIAVADVDGDRRFDIYFVNQLGGNELWRNLGGGKFENITAEAGAGLPGKIHVAASFADIDNDGDPDLLVTTVNMGNILLENDGRGRFRDITGGSGLNQRGHSSGAVFFDYDRDGLLDLFICNVGVYTTPEIGPGGFSRAIDKAFHGHLFPERSEKSILYRNLGGNRFRDVSPETGLIHAGWSGDASFADLNGDGFPDLYVLNMQGDDRFYENQGGKRFVDRTAAYFPKTPWGAMGLKFFDFNLDGLPDLFVADMHSDMTDPQSVTGRATMASTFEKMKSDQWCSTAWTDAFLQGASNNIFGNAFYVNRGGGKFAESSQQLGAETYWPWGPSVGDVNADGYEDIFITAGMGWPFRYGLNSLLLNVQGRQFAEAEFVLGVEPRLDGRITKKMFLLDCSQDADRAHQLCRENGPYAEVHGALSSRSSVLFDLDDDGDLDIVTNEMNDRPMVLMSDLSQRSPIHFLKVKLVGSASNHDGIGASVKVVAGTLSMIHYNDGKSGYLGQSVLPIYFGLGAVEKASSVEVIWPSGRKQVVTSPIPQNGVLTVQESR